MRKIFVLVISLSLSSALSFSETLPQHYLTYAGVEPLYKDGFKNLHYVNPEAPKGGKIHLSATGTFDSFNPYIIKGNPFPTHNTTTMHFIFESLMSEPLDDNLVNYCFLAEHVEHPEDNTYVIFKLRNDITFSDGTKAGADDLVFTFNILLEKGLPYYRSYYKDVEKVEKLDDLRVKFHFKNPKNKELAMILGQLPLLSKAFWADKKFDETHLTPVLGTGPYMISSFEPGRKIKLKLNPHYWGKNHPLAKGRWNFDQIVYDYFKDYTITLQAFKAGDLDFRMEVKALDWVKEYDGPSFKSGYHVKETLSHQTPAGRLGLYFNLRKKIFQDIRVREALTELFDFEWLNKSIFNSLYQRTISYFQNTELAASHLPEGQERTILEPFRKDLDERVFTEIYAPPKTDGSGNIRRGLHKALQLFKQAGWIIKDDKLVHETTGEPFAFEFLIPDQSLERILQPYVNNLDKAGIHTRLRLADTAQYQMRENKFDYDVLYTHMGITFSPGNEQEAYWGSKFADRDGSENKTGLKDPVIDALIQKIINVKDRNELIATSKAFDRVLSWKFLSIPLYHNSNYWLAYKNRFGIPKVRPKVGLGFPDTWWIDPEKDKALDAKKP